jgi:hypothetical protein
MMKAPVTLNDQMPMSWRAAVMAALQPDESVLSWVVHDLSPSLQFGAGLVVLTNQRFLAAVLKSPPGHFLALRARQARSARTI